MEGVLFDVERYNESDKKVAISTWNVIFDCLGIYQEHEKLKEMFIKGYFSSYMEWTNEAYKVLQKHGLAKVVEIINNRPLMKEVKKALGELKKRGYKTAVITENLKALARGQRIYLVWIITISHCKLIF
jgi:phosphoserine phosphatase